MESKERMNTFSVKGKEGKEGDKEGREESKDGGRKGAGKKGRKRERERKKLLFYRLPRATCVVSISPTIILGAERVTHVTAHLSDPCSHLSFSFLFGRDP